MTQVKFHFEALAVPGTARGTLRYIREESSFRFDYQDAAVLADSYTLLFGTVQLDVLADSGLVVGAWGFLPIDHARRSQLDPGFDSGRITVRGVEPPPHGVAIQLVGLESIVVEHDVTSGWTRVARRDVDPDPRRPILFSDGCAAEITAAGALVALWMKPTSHESPETSD
jgi:hypothetical protein